MATGRAVEASSKPKKRVKIGATMPKISNSPIPSARRMPNSTAPTLFIMPPSYQACLGQGVLGFTHRALPLVQGNQLAGKDGNPSFCNRSAQRAPNPRTPPSDVVHISRLKLELV